MAATPPFLFRVWSNSSNGMNGITVFTPASGPLPTVTASNAKQLRDALLGREFDGCPFIFWTPSLLYALVVAGYKKGHGETNIHLTCLSTATARTQSGEIVDFRSASSMLEEYNVTIKNRSDGSVRTYASEYISTGVSVRLGEGSGVVRYETMIQNRLFDLYPELSEVQERRRPRWYLTLSDLREYWHGNEQGRHLTVNEIETAFEIIAGFSSSSDSGARSGDVPVYFFASLLALRKRTHSDEVVLRQWISNRTSTGEHSKGATFHLSEYTHSRSDKKLLVQPSLRQATDPWKEFTGSSTLRPQVIDLTADSGDDDDDEDEDNDDSMEQIDIAVDELPEVVQANSIYAMLVDKTLQRSHLISKMHISPADIALAKREWHTWHRASRAKHRARREERPEPHRYRVNKARRYGNRESREERSDRRRGPREGYRERRGERDHGRRAPRGDLGPHEMGAGLTINRVYGARRHGHGCGQRT